MIHRPPGAGFRAVALAIALGLSTAPASAVVGSLDTVPAATLLLPYFEVDLADANGAQTRFSLVNTNTAPVLAKVTLWSNLGVPTFNFDVYLEGRDTQDIDLRLLFRGVVPQTGPGLVSLGSLSSASVAFPQCTTGANTATGVSLPVTAPLSAAQTAHLAAAHTGRPSATLGNLCAGKGVGNDQVARGYVTIDVVRQCSTSFPTDVGYFLAGGTGIAGNTNALTGTFTLIERNGQSRAAVSALVHLEADGVAAATTTPGSYTFYSAYVANTAVDNREPAGSVWSARNWAAPFDASTDVLVWRDPAGRAPVPFACALTPSPFPLSQQSIVTWDEAETFRLLNADVVFPNPQPPPVNPVPFAAQRTNAAAYSPFDAGWALLNLNTFITGGPAAHPGVRQSVVLTRNRRDISYSPFLSATYVAGPLLQDGGPTSCSGGEDQCSGFPSY